jgi:serine/threonine-protein kinase
VVLCERGGYSDFAKVVDFGLVKDLSPSGDATRSVVHSLVGTPLYLAPEVFSGRELDERSDLYSLGALAYFLLTSQPVFRGETLVEICAKHLHAPVVPPSQLSPNEVPPQLQAIVLSCLEKQPERRPSSAEALVAALEAVHDTPLWTPADARAWWAERGPAARRSIRPDEAEAASQLLAVDLRAQRAPDLG